MGIKVRLVRVCINWGIALGLKALCIYVCVACGIGGGSTLCGLLSKIELGNEVMVLCHVW